MKRNPSFISMDLHQINAELSAVASSLPEGSEAGKLVDVIKGLTRVVSDVVSNLEEMHRDSRGF